MHPHIDLVPIFEYGVSALAILACIEIVRRIPDRVERRVRELNAHHDLLQTQRHSD